MLPSASAVTSLIEATANRKDACPSARTRSPRLSRIRCDQEWSEHNAIDLTRPVAGPVAASTAAPAPSANCGAVSGSETSRKRDSKSAPTTSAFRPGRNRYGRRPSQAPTAVRCRRRRRRVLRPDRRRSGPPPASEGQGRFRVPVRLAIQSGSTPRWARSTCWRPMGRAAPSLPRRFRPRPARSAG